MQRVRFVGNIEPNPGVTTYTSGAGQVSRGETQPNLAVSCQIKRPPIKDRPERGYLRCNSGCNCVLITKQHFLDAHMLRVDPAAPGDRSRGSSPAFRHKLAIATAADSEYTAPPCETRRPPKPASREEPTVAGADDTSTGTGTDLSSGSECAPCSPRSRSNDRLRCVPEIDETLGPAGSFYKRRTSDNFRATRSCRIVAPLAQLQDPGAHAILAADANFKMHSEATEELGQTPSTDETIGVSPTEVLVHGSLARTGSTSFSKRSTSETASIPSAALVAACAEHPMQCLGLTTTSRYELAGHRPGRLAPAPWVAATAPRKRAPRAFLTLLTLLGDRV